MVNQTGKTALLLLVMLVGIMMYFLWSVYKDGLVSSPSSNTRQDSTEKLRQSYNFDELLSENFLLYSNKEVGFSVEYPKQAELYNFGSEVGSGAGLSSLKVDGGISFSLVAQLAEQTELFDGMSVTVTYYSNSSKLSLDSLEEKLHASLSTYEDIEIADRKRIRVNDEEGLTIVLDGWGGATKNYYFLASDGRYVVNIETYSVGPEKEMFDLVAEKIVKSFRSQ